MPTLFKSKFDLISGTNIKEVRKNFEKVHDIKYHKNKRRLAYIKSHYYGGDKVFTREYFNHCGKIRHHMDAMRRLKLFEAGADLIEKSTSPPILEYKTRRGVGHRFIGQTKSGQKFYVQILVKKNGSKHLMSTFPAN